jgi:uncharacterized RDD family membrane protein YckC
MDTIDIRTTQNVVINYELAPLRDRFVGILIDVVIILAIHILLSFLSVYLFDSGQLLQTIIGYFGLLAFFFYTLSMEIFNNGQTLGKAAAGTKVLKADGSEPSLSDYLIRVLFHMIDFLLSFGVLGAIFIATSDKRQRLGDRAANTVVVKLNVANMFNLKDILNISTLEDYDPIYPDIKNVKEGDMLVIKNALLRHRNNPSINNKSMVNTLAMKMIKLLDIKEKPKNNVKFLKTLIKDYIVLTR